MSKKTAILFLLALALAAAPLLGQRLTDDRELFTGVASKSRVYPNIVILADSSGSMRLVITHPDYIPRYNYKKASPANPLAPEVYSLSGLSTVGIGDDPDTGLKKLNNFTSFYICRGRSASEWVWDASAQFYSANNRPYYWRVYKSTAEGTLTSGQVLSYWKNSQWCTVTIDYVDSTSDTRYHRIYLTTTNPPCGAPSQRGDWLYANRHQETSVNNNLAKFVTNASDCTGFDETKEISLYGDTWSANGHTYYTDYETNYFYWLAFHASITQLNEVTHWATTGSFRNDASGNPIIAGYYRQQVLKDVLKEVLNEVWAGNTNYNFGLYKFDPASAGAELLNNLQNANTPGVENAFRNSIDTIQPRGSTPLAEALADIWVYFKEGQSSTNYQPAGADNLSSCGSNSGTSGHPATSCPIQNYCQKNYVIVMTDGTATHDNFGESKYTDAANNIFLEDVSVWGDGDNRDPAHHGDYQPTTGLTPNDDETPYCPEGTCWGQNLPGWGTDYLDDVAYYMKNNDLFPNGDPDLFPDMPGVQNIETFTIGFTIYNDLLRDTAINGNTVGASAYYTSNNFAELKDNLVGIINNIQLREFGFSSITAPKKLTTTFGEGHSFVGYFVPSASSALWTGHMQSYLLTDYWYVDTNGNDQLDKTETLNEFVNPYSSETNCESAPANAGKQCLRGIRLGDNLGPSDGGYEWDAKDEMTLPRQLFTHDDSPTMIPFTLINIDTLKPLFLIPGTADEITTIAGNIILKLNERLLGDIFHSDLAYVGPPMSAKRYVRNLNPTTCGDDPATPKNDDPDCFEYLLTHNTSRTKVVYVGTNEGILHQVDAGNGVERWGFIPDEVLPNLKTIINSNAYTYTVDGRLSAEDIYYRSGSGNSWKTILTFGLRDGGNSFYTLDVTGVSDQPTLLWKFNDATYSGKSWSKPYIGKVRLLESGVYVDRWVVIVAGGMAFNNEDTSSSAGKAVFVIDASSGNLLWMIGYNDDLGEVDSTSTAYIDTTPVGVRYLTKSADFNYPIPAAITPVDADQDGFLDSIYFGNVAGHLFKTDIKAGSVANWRTYPLFKKDLSYTGKPQGTISAIGTDPEGKVLTLGTAAKSFIVEQNIIGLQSKAMGIIEATSNTTITVTTISNAQFQVGELVYVPTFDPIFLSPAVSFDPCWNLWVCFGTGDRIRSRTNPDSGKFVAFRENTNTQTTNVGINDLVPLSWTKTGDVWNMDETNLKSTANKDKIGWQFTFPMASNHEKLFDPEPLVLPDPNMIPEIYFNTYQPSLGAIDLTNPCAPPATGIMYLYKIKNNYCGDGKVNGTAESGRIAGGGVFQGTDYLLYEGKGDVASIPPLQDTRSIKMIYTGSMLFWKEKKR